jgi:hypothetical protein
MQHGRIIKLLAAIVASMRDSWLRRRKGRSRVSRGRASRGKMSRGRVGRGRASRGKMRIRTAEAG